MDDSAADGIKAKLDKELSTADANAGIAFGLELFDKFRDRGWITLKKFGVLGTNFGATKLPAYGSRCAHRTWDLGEHEFKVGQNA